MKLTHKKLLIVLIKIAIMGLVIAGIILINRKYMSNADGSEKVGQKTLIERAIKPGVNTETRWERDLLSYYYTTESIKY